MEGEMEANVDKRSNELQLALAYAVVQMDVRMPGVASRWPLHSGARDV